MVLGPVITYDSTASPSYSDVSVFRSSAEEDSRRSNGQVLTTPGARRPNSGFRLLTTNGRTVCRETCTVQMRRVLTRWPLPEPSLPKQAGKCH